MLNRRAALQSSLALPLFAIHKPKNRILEIADYIEKDFIKGLSNKNPVISSLKKVEIYDDPDTVRHRNVSGFYGWTRIDLYPRKVIYTEPFNVTYSENVLNLVNHFRSAEYGHMMELDFLLTREETQEVLNTLWKKAGYKGYGK